MNANSLIAEILDNAGRTPNATALVFDDETVTYGQLVRRAGQFAENLSQNPEAMVGLLAPKTPDGIALVLGSLLARRPFLLPSLTLAEQTRTALFEAAGCAAVVSPDDFPAVTDAFCTPLDLVQNPAAATFHLTTSGSTGMPKVVPLAEGAIDRFTDWAGERFGLDATTTVLNYAPLNFDLCLLDIWATLKHGGRVVLVDPARATNAQYLADLLRRYEVSVMQSVPMPFQLLADTAETFPHLRHVIVTGDAIPAATLGTFPALFPGAQMYNLYGCTETNDSMLFQFERDALPTGKAPLGEPVSGVSTVVVDDAGEIVVSGVGELYVNTPFQTNGYLDPALNNGRFVPHPAGADDLTYYRTGDLVEVAQDGRMTLVGRNDFQVKVRGVRTNIGEIERVFAAHSDIAETVTIAIPDPVAGNRLHAISRRREGSGLNGLVLRQYLAQRLPRTAIPTTIQFIETPLPRTSTGKPDRQLLLQQHS
jgi:non-ribosomal peptide synthetase component F